MMLPGDQVFHALSSCSLVTKFPTLYDHTPCLPSIPRVPSAHVQEFLLRRMHSFQWLTSQADHQMLHHSQN